MRSVPLRPPPRAHPRADPEIRRAAAPALAASEAVRHTYECPLRWADMDLLGHVNNVVYVDYLQEARVDMSCARPPAGAPGRGAASTAAVVVRHEVSYLRP